MRNSGCWCCISTIVPTYLVLPSIPSFILCLQEMLREVKMPLIYFPEDRVTGCAGTGIGQASVSSTHTTNPRHVEKKKNSRTLMQMWSSKVCLLITLLHRRDIRTYHSFMQIYPMISLTYKIDVLISSVMPAHGTCPDVICHSGTLKLHVLLCSYSGSCQCSLHLMCLSLLSQCLLPNLSPYWRPRTDVFWSSKTPQNIERFQQIYQCL